MADRPNADDPSYDWLYAGQYDAPERATADERPGVAEPASERPDADHTRMLPQSPRPTAGRPGTDPDPTRTIRVPPPAGASPGSDAAPPQAPQPSVRQQSPTSFGGTYPKASAAPRPAAAPAPPIAPLAGQGVAGAGGGQRYAQPTTARTGGYGPPGGPGGPGGAGGYAPPAGPATRRPRRKRRFRWVRIVLALVVAWLLFLAIVPIYAWSQVSKVDAEPSGARPAGGPGTTYLLVGSDSREGLTKQQESDLGTGAASGQRTDTIILLHVTDGNGPNIMLSIPRDSYVEVPGHGMNKINAAYAYGGPKLLVQTVELATKIKVDDYIEIGFTGVVDVVDAVGGITVCPKTSIDDPKAGNLKMKAGCQHVDGHVALDYSRSRAFPLGDITRAFHQREVIAATGAAAASWQTVVFPWRYWRVNLAGARSVQVGDNVGPVAFARFAWAMAHSSGSGTKRCVVPFSSLGTSTSVGSVVEWDTTKANALFHDIITDDTSAIHCQGQ